MTTYRGLTPEQRFWSHVNKSENCWEWTGATNTSGYGFLKALQKNHLAHRYSLQLAGIEIPEGHVVDHRCHNILCVRPAHLRVVTEKQNHEHRKGANSNSSTGIRGAFWNKQTSRYTVQVGHRGRTYYGGQFTDLDEAAEAARQLRLSLYTHNDLDRKETA